MDERLTIEFYHGPVVWKFDDDRNPTKQHAYRLRDGKQLPFVRFVNGEEK